jgi:flagellar M-ring protein FliF
VDQLRTVLATIQKHLGGMNPSQKLLIGSLAVIMLMTLFLVSQYAGRPTMVELWPGASTEDQQRAMTVLRTSAIRHEDRGGRVYIPAERRLDAMAVLAQAGQQPSNSAVVFENILKTQNWMNSREQNRQIYKVMVDNWLSGVLSKFEGIRSADVFVDAPESVGLGQAARPPKASVTLFTQSGRPLEQATVDAAARLVAGSVAGLELDRVSVADGSSGRPRRVTRDDDLVPATWREYAASIEKHFQRKIENLVGDIQPPAVVEVTASVDVTRVQAQVNKNLPVGEGSVSLLRRETSSSTTESQPAAGAEPGVRSNAAADISLGSGRSGARTEQKEEESEFVTAIGTRTERIDDPRGQPTRLVATVAIPRSFIAGLIQRDRGGGREGLSDAEIDMRFASERERLIRFLRPHLQVQGPQGDVVEGEVEVTLMSGDPFFAAGGGRGGGGTFSTASTGGGGGALGAITVLGSGIIDKAVLGILAVVALAMMALMVRKASRRPETPSAEEIAGLPPTLEMTSDLVGEADETETAIPGILVGEEEIKATKLREQVSELIRKDPEVAGKMLNRWVAVEH